MSAERCVVRAQASTSRTDFNTHAQSPSEFSFSKFHYKNVSHFEFESIAKQVLRALVYSLWQEVACDHSQAY